MSEFETPLPLDALAESGRRWAAEQVYDDTSADVMRHMKGLYHGGLLLWQAHRGRLQDRIKEGGGIKEVTRVIGERGINCLVLNNGKNIDASSILKAPAITLSTTDGFTKLIERRYTQVHTLQLGFGGQSFGSEFERGDYDIDHYYLDADLKGLINDDALFPEEVGVIEGVTTTLDQGPIPWDRSDRSTTDEAYYSLFGKVWGANALHEDPMPDPFSDPIGYRKWALGTNPQIALFFQAPVLRRSEDPTSIATSTVIDQYGDFSPNGEIAISRLDRFRQLLGCYATRQYPELFPDGITDLSDQPNKPTLELQ